MKKFNEKAINSGVAEPFTALPTNRAITEAGPVVIDLDGPNNIYTTAGVNAVYNPFTGDSPASTPNAIA